MKIVDEKIIRQILADVIDGKQGLVRINGVCDSDRINSKRIIPVFESVEEFRQFHPSFENKIEQEIRRRENAGDPGFMQDRMSREAYEDSLYRYLKEGEFQKRFEDEVKSIRKNMIDTALIVDEKELGDLQMVRIKPNYPLKSEADTCFEMFSSSRLAEEFATECNRNKLESTLNRYYVQSVDEAINQKSQRGE